MDKEPVQQIETIEDGIEAAYAELAQADALDAEADAMDAQANELIETAVKTRREAAEIRARYKSVAADDAPLRKLKELADAKREVKEPDERG
jgi:hypothetical protein